jgi:tRNA-(ms[2]io[6]A)-hydroxylase
MLRLKLKTDPRWVSLVQRNLQEVLTDHAWCEQKAVSNAISLIVNYPEYTGLVNTLTEIAQEELLHFQQVHQIIQARGFTFGRERKDDYVNELYKFIQPGRGRQHYLMDRLLFSAMIEARSCERFKVLAENIEDPELIKFYETLMISEAQHYTVFIGLAREYVTEFPVEKRWEEFLEFEGEVIQRYGQSERIHG